MNQPAFVRRFRFFGILTVVSVYLLILVGGIVRSTGSGMGCPDWPKCFGTWVPPTTVGQLPSNYKEIYTQQRVAKNQRMAQTLDRLGFQKVAAQIFAQPTQYIETDFNATKTWIEYLNRLLGALIGVFIFLTVLLALPYRRRDPVVFWLVFASFLLTGFQGWLGSLVVSTNLLPEMVTVHMALALLIVALLIYAVNRSQRESEDQFEARWVPTKGLTTWLWVITLATFSQIMLGTQVREQVDAVAVAADYGSRGDWIEQLGLTFKVHRSFSSLLLLANAYVAFHLYKTRSRKLEQLAVAVIALLVLEIAAGVTLAYFALPAAVQPVHLTLATVLFGAQFLAIIHYSRRTKTVMQATIPRVVA